MSAHYTYRLVGVGSVLSVENGDLEGQPAEGKDEQDDKQHYHHLQEVNHTFMYKIYDLKGDKREKYNCDPQGRIQDFGKGGSG